MIAYVDINGDGVDEVMVTDPFAIPSQIEPHKMESMKSEKNLIYFADSDK